MSCDVCKILENKDSFMVVHEDEKCFAILHEGPAIAGHTLLIPKNHATIMEEVEDDVVAHLFATANVISTKLFETLGAQGTNILVNNGHGAGQEMPHLVIHIVPRIQDDGINLEWPPKQATQDELKRVLSRITFSGSEILKGTAPKTIKAPEVIANDVHKEDNTAKSVDNHDHEEPEEEDYLVKSLKRMP